MDDLLLDERPSTSVAIAPKANTCSMCRHWTTPDADHELQNWGACAIPLSGGTIAKAHRDYRCSCYAKDVK